MKLKPNDTVTYIEDIIYLLKYNIKMNWEWARPMYNVGFDEPYIKTSAARSEIVTEMYR